jgi:hypothetical protein
VRHIVMALLFALTGIGAFSSSKPPEFIFTVRLRPAFHRPSTVTIRSRWGKTSIILKYDDSKDSYVSKEQYSLSSSVAKEFFEKMQTLVLSPPGERAETGTDGICVAGKFTVGRLTYSFSFWSPSSDSPREYEMCRALFNAIAAARLPEETTCYFEDLEVYFNFCLPVKDLGGYPHQYRLYGVLYESHWPALLELFHCFQPNELIILDARRLWGIAWNLQPCFSELLSGQASIHWWAGQSAAEDLLAVGIPREDITIY